MTPEQNKAIVELFWSLGELPPGDEYDSFNGRCDEIYETWAKVSSIEDADETKQ
jgi:hypothetical protein